MKSMFDPFRPAVFKAASLKRVSLQIVPKVSPIIVAVPLLLSWGCQSKNLDKQLPIQLSTSETRPQEDSEATDSSPLSFTNPQQIKNPQEIIVASYNVENL